MSPHVFFFMFCIWRSFKIKVTFVTFCVKGFSSGYGGKTKLKVSTDYRRDSTSQNSEKKLRNDSESGCRGSLY